MASASDVAKRMVVAVVAASTVVSAAMADLASGVSAAQAAALWGMAASGVGLGFVTFVAIEGLQSANSELHSAQRSQADEIAKLRADFRTRSDEGRIKYGEQKLTRKLRRRASAAVYERTGSKFRGSVAWRAGVWYEDGGRWLCSPVESDNFRIMTGEGDWIRPSLNMLPEPIKFGSARALDGFEIAELMTGGGSQTFYLALQISRSSDGLDTAVGARELRAEGASLMREVFGTFASSEDLKEEVFDFAVLHQANDAKVDVGFGAV